MPAKCISPEAIALNREIRSHIGRQLRGHYDLAQRMPLPARLAELARQFGQPVPDEDPVPPSSLRRVGLNEG
jgi:hypothetical protein